MTLQGDKATVAFLGGSLRMGGAERQIIRLLRGLSDTPYRPVLVLKRIEGALLDEIAGLDVRILELGFKRLQTLRGYAALRRLRRFIEDENVRILQSYLYGGHLVGALALHSTASWRGFPRPHHLICVRSHYLPRPSIMKPFYRWAGRRAAAAVAVSDDVAGTMRGWGIPRDKCVVIPNGVPLIEPVSEEERLQIRAGLGATEGRALMGMVGNFRAGKGHEDLIRALALLHDGGKKNWDFVFIGDGPTRASMQELAERLGVGNRIHFAGHRDDATTVLPALDLFVYPSHTEGMPNALLEAMAAGLPCVASDIPVHRDLLEEGRVGRLVPIGSPEELCRVITDQIGEHETGELGSLAKERIRGSFSLERMVGDYLRLYESVLSKEGP